jgi:hypothetical protein
MEYESGLYLSPRFLWSGNRPINIQLSHVGVPIRHTRQRSSQRHISCVVIPEIEYEMMFALLCCTRPACVTSHFATCMIRCDM